MLEQIDSAYLFYFLAAASAVLFVEEVLWVLVAPAFWPMKYMAAVLAAYYGQLFFGKVVGAQWVNAGDVVRVGDTDLVVEED